MTTVLTKLATRMLKPCQLCALILLAGGSFPCLAQDEPAGLGDFLLPNQIVQDLPRIGSVAPSSPLDGNILQTSGCASCGTSPMGSGLGRMTGGGIAPNMYDPVGCCAGSECGQGRSTCYGCEHDGVLARMLCGIYECLACPDPCYEPGWRPIMDIGFFTECARPISQQRVRMTAFQNMTNYTRNSYKMAPPSLGPTVYNQSTKIYAVAPSVNIYEASLYTEIAAGNVGVILDVPFLMTDFSGGIGVTGSSTPSENYQTYGGSGFGNMTTGIKSTIFDSELLQVGWKTVTSLPVGIPLKGLGNGLTSMEIGALIGLKISEDSYLQANLTEWIPFGGLWPYPGAMFITRLSLNHKVWQANPKVPVFVNLEYSGYFFQAGSYLPYGGGGSATSYLPLYSAGGSYQQLGPGIRMFMTEKMDAGFAAQFSLNPESGSWGDQQYRLDFRFRY